MGAKCSKSLNMVPNSVQKISQFTSLLYDGINYFYNKDQDTKISQNTKEEELMAFLTVKESVKDSNDNNKKEIDDNNNQNNSKSDITADNTEPNDNNIKLAKTREAMKQYWAEHSKSEKTNSLMLLMQDNDDFELAERYEILSYLPDVSNLDIVELGAGVGRFTGELASHAKSILAVDFIEDFLRENAKRHNRVYDNITFLHKDVTILTLETQSKDFIFSNWLMMYLNDEEVKKLIIKMYSWCKSGGYIFFRESCEGGASGDKPRTNNPTYYRKHEFYTKCFAAFDDLTLIHCKTVQCYIDQKNKTNQYCWLYYKD